MAEGKFTEQQERFVQEYLVDLNGTAAAKRAGYGPKSAEQQAVRLLTLPHVAQAIAEGKAARLERTQADQDRVITELQCMAHYDAGEIGMHDITGPKDISKLPEHLRRAVIGWNWDKKGDFCLKLSPKTPSLDLLARHYGLLVNRHQQLGADGKPIDPPASHLVIIEG